MESVCTLIRTVGSNPTLSEVFYVCKFQIFAFRETYKDLLDKCLAASIFGNRVRGFMVMFWTTRVESGL